MNQNDRATTEQALQAQLKTYPDNTELYRQLGKVREHDGDLAGAIAAYAGRVAKVTDDYDAWCRIGFLQLRLSQLDEAIATFRFVRDMVPSYAEAWYGLAILSSLLGRTEQAAVDIEKACSLAPQDSRVWAARAHILSTVSSDNERVFQGYRDWAVRFADPRSKHAAPFNNQRDVNKTLRIGYVSADFNSHSVAYFIEPVLRLHDHQAVEIYIFSNGHHDGVSDRLQVLVDHWIDVRRMNDVELFCAIRQREIDVLVDLSGHTNGNRLLVFAMRAAPVQVTWFAYMHTTGMCGMDYRLTDLGIHPDGSSQRWFSETLFYLKNMVCFAPDPSTPLNPEPPCLRNGYVTFGCLNALRKVSDQVLTLWRDILLALPDARLMLSSSMLNLEQAVEMHAAHLAELGLPMARVSLMPRLSIQAFLALGEQIDIALDPFPTSGGTTTLHTIWMGLPVVVMEGELAHEKASAAILRGSGLGLGEAWICHDAQQYLALACKLAGSPGELVRFRQENREKMINSYMMDSQGLTRDLECAYRAMWANWLLSEKRYLSTDHYRSDQASSPSSST